MSQLESRLGGLEQALTDLSRQLAEAGLLGDVPHLTPPQTRRQEQREARRRVEEMGSRDGSVDKGTGNGGVVGEPPPAGGGRGGAAVDTGGGGTSSSGRGGGGGSGSGAASALPSSETMSGEKAAEASGITSLQPRIIGFINSGYLQAVKVRRHNKKQHERVWLW